MHGGVGGAKARKPHVISLMVQEAAAEVEAAEVEAAGGAQVRRRGLAWRAQVG
jgi:hypothetical protein